MLDMMMGGSGDLGAELHAISCACKPVTGWLARDGIQECREACGGHGYLKSMTNLSLSLPESLVPAHY